MANKRMFKKEIVESDPFVLMPISAQALYFHLCMNADDDGILNSPVKIQRAVGASEADLQTLIDKRFILSFDNGVVVIKHWLMQNTIRKDRYTPTQFQDVLSRLTIKENMAYTDHGNQNGDSGNQNAVFGNQVATKTPICPPQIRLELDKGSVRLEQGSSDTDINLPPTTQLNAPIDGGGSAAAEESKPEVKRKDVEKVKAAWNTLGLKTIIRIDAGTERGRQTKARIQDFGVDAVLEAIENVRNSDFLCGKNKKKWTATYDWFISPSNFQKVLEGNYSTTYAEEESDTDNIFLKMLEEEYGQK